MNLEMLVTDAKNGDKEAAARILESFKPFIIKTSKTIFLRGYGMEDLIQIGYITLLKAIMKFKPQGNNKFLPYAYQLLKIIITMKSEKNVKSMQKAA